MAAVQVWEGMAPVPARRWVGQGPDGFAEDAAVLMRPTHPSVRTARVWDDTIGMGAEHVVELPSIVAR